MSKLIFTDLLQITFQVDKFSSLRVYAKRVDETMEDLLFDAPKVTKDSRRWFREGKTIPFGSYQYVSLYEICYL